MKDALIIIVHWLSGITGGLLIYLAVFLYENQQGQLQNTLEVWWIRIDDLRTAMISRETAFLKTIANVTTMGFDRVFGKRLFGPKAIAASIAYSVASMFLAGLCDATIHGRLEFAQPFFTAFLGVLFLVLGSLGPLLERVFYKWVWLTFVAIVAPIAILYAGFYGFNASAALPEGKWQLKQWFNYCIHNRLLFGVYFGQCIMLPLAVLCDLLFILVTRKVLRYTSVSISFFAVISIMIGNLLLAVVLVVLPYIIGDSVFPRGSEKDFLVGSIFGFLAQSNCLDVVVGSCWFLIATLMLLHRIIWPLIEKPIYALQKYHVLTENRRIVFFGGVTLVGLSNPSVRAAFETIIAAAHL